MAWIYLIAAGILETLWAVAMKASNGFTLLIPSLITVLAMIGSVALLALAMRTLPLGTAYVVWTGIGAVGAFAAGVVMFGESLSLMRVTAAGFIVVGLIMAVARFRRRLDIPLALWFRIDAADHNSGIFCFRRRLAYVRPAAPL